jgi:hypothetical protein
MKNKITILYFAIAILLAIGMYTIAKINKTEAPILATKTDGKSFTSTNGNLMVVDSFVMLINKAYSGFVTITKNTSTLNVTIANANAMTKDFFNGNDELLKYTIADFGFAIKYLASPPSITAQFNIQNNAVFVPNDVLIKALDKTSNAKNSIK